MRAAASPAGQESTNAPIQLLPSHLAHPPALLPCPICMGYKQGVTAGGRRPNLPISVSLYVSSDQDLVILPSTCLAYISQQVPQELL